MYLKHIVVLFIFCEVQKFVKCQLMNIVDLGHALNSRAPHLDINGVEPFTLDIVQRGFFPTGWRASNKFSVTTFVGTNMLSPYSFSEFGWKINEIPQENLFPEAHVIDISSKAAKNPLYELTSEDVEEWLDDKGKPKGKVVIFIRTDWDKKYNSSEEYLGVPPNYTFPGVSEGAARTILRMKNKLGIDIVGVGIDGPCLDNFVSHNFLTRQLLASENIYMLQNLKNLELLPPRGARLIVAPLRFEGAAGVPTRVIASLSPKLPKSSH